MTFALWWSSRSERDRSLSVLYLLLHHCLKPTTPVLQRFISGKLYNQTKVSLPIHTAPNSWDQQLLNCQDHMHHTCTHRHIHHYMTTQRHTYTHAHGYTLKVWQSQIVTFLPNPISVPVTHIISDTSVASDRAAVGTFPYLIWKGSIMVTYFLSLIGLAKNRPPQG